MLRKTEYFGIKILIRRKSDNQEKMAIQSLGPVVAYLQRQVFMKKEVGDL